MIFEYPITPLLKLSLDFERCYLNFLSLAELQNKSAYRAALHSLTQLIRLIDKPEVKAKYFQFFVQLEQTLEKLKQHAKTDSNKLQFLINTIASVNVNFEQQKNHKYSHSLLEESLLSAAFERSIHKLHKEEHPSNFIEAWLNQDNKKLNSDFRRWTDKLEIIASPIFTKLKIIRELGTFEEKFAENGFYQEGFHPKRCFLVRIQLPPENEIIYPEVTTGYHGLSVKFFVGDFISPSQKNTPPTSFQRALCQL